MLRRCFQFSLYAVLLFTFRGYSQTLPKPLGKYPVGTRVFHLVDKSRFDTLFKINRVITVQLWYPAVKKTGSQLMDYIPEKKLAGYIAQSKYYGVDSNILASFYTLKTHAFKNAPMVKEPRQFPVVFFSPGLGVLRSNYTSLFEDLASKGIIVASVDHMYEGCAILPDGRIADINAYPDSVLTNLTADCIQDISVCVTALFNVQTGVGRFLHGRIDITRICTSGHSLGGNIAMCSASTDRRINCSINLDGGDFECQTTNLKTPTLLVLEKPDYSDEELIKKGRDVKKWRADSLVGLKPFFKILQGSSAKAFLVKLWQTGHMSFSDAPFLMPKLLTMFLGTYLNPKENLQIITGLMNDFVRNFYLPSIKLVEKFSSYKNVRVWDFNR